MLNRLNERKMTNGSPRNKTARRARFAVFAGGAGRRFARHLLSAVLVLILLMNTFAFAADDFPEAGGLWIEGDDGLIARSELHKTQKTF